MEEDTLVPVSTEETVEQPIELTEEVPAEAPVNVPSEEPMVSFTESRFKQIASEIYVSGFLASTINFNGDFPFRDNRKHPLANVQFVEMLTNFLKTLKYEN